MCRDTKEQVSFYRKRWSKPSNAISKSVMMKTGKSALELPNGRLSVLYAKVIAMKL